MICFSPPPPSTGKAHKLGTPVRKSPATNERLSGIQLAPNHVVDGTGCSDSTLPVTVETVDRKCHNLVVLIHEMYELGIDPVFWDKKEIVN